MNCLLGAAYIMQCIVCIIVKSVLLLFLKSYMHCITARSGRGGCVERSIKLGQVWGWCGPTHPTLDWRGAAPSLSAAARCHQPCSPSPHWYACLPFVFPVSCIENEMGFVCELYTVYYSILLSTWHSLNVKILHINPQTARCLLRR